MSYADKEFRDLTERQSAFVRNYIELGGSGHVTDAVLMAGYNCSTRESAAAYGCTLLRNDKILKALKRLAETKMQADAYHATKVISVMALEGKTPQGLPVTPELQLKAALETANRAGLAVAAQLKVTHDHKHTHGFDRSQTEVIENIYRLAAQLDLETNKLGNLKALPAPRDEAIDVDYEVIDRQSTDADELIDWTQPL